MLDIRPEQSADYAGIREVLTRAFPTPAEADLVERLRAAGRVPLSLVATRDDQIVGHILFSPVTIDSGRAGFSALGLAPMAVLPEWQRQGIGSRMVRTGLEGCRRAGCACVVVLGHPEYYPRFGFVPASRYGVRSEYDVPDEVFMLLELREGALRGQTGTARYGPEFAKL